MERSLLINGLTFLAISLLVYWKLSDPRNITEHWKYYLKPKSTLIWLFTLLFFTLNYLSGRYFPLPASGFDDLISLMGVLAFFAGCVIAIWAKVTMGRVWEVPAEHDKKRQNELIRNGPFKYSRNPIYLGLIMLLVGYGLAIQSLFTFLALVPIFYFWDFVRKEEKLLEQHFKEEYLKYKKDVPRFF